ncbi:MAG: hypothetical protein ABIT38_12380 [Gemmatimonadaceae bacterium]
MNGPEVLVPLAFFATVAVIFVNVLRYKERARGSAMGTPQTYEIASRLDRMEQAIDSIAVEVERISEGQRFTTRLLSERSDAPAVPIRGERQGDRMGA